MIIFEILKHKICLNIIRKSEKNENFRLGFFFVYLSWNSFGSPLIFVSQKRFSIICWWIWYAWNWDIQQFANWFPSIIWFEDNQFFLWMKKCKQFLSYHQTSGIFVNFTRKLLPNIRSLQIYELILLWRTSMPSNQLCGIS